MGKKFIIAMYDKEGSMLGFLPDVEDWSKSMVFSSSDSAKDFILANSKEDCDLRVWSEEDMS